MRSSRWHRSLVAASIVLLVGVCFVTRANSAPPRITTRIAEAQVSLWKCQDQLGVERSKKGTDPWSLPKSTKVRMRVLNKWSVKWNDCLQDLQEKQRQWNWQAWLPPIWRAIGMCETQLNWQHNSGTYQGAFGFYHGSWDAFRPAGYPTEAYLASPWQQYQVALRIYNRYGFSGWGCYTHGGYKYHL